MHHFKLETYDSHLVNDLFLEKIQPLNGNLKVS
jgi:hypothetical protein